MQPRMFQPANRLTPPLTDGLYKLALATILFLSQLQKVMGDTCFQIGGNDFSLTCGRDEKTIFNHLVSQCFATQYPCSESESPLPDNSTKLLINALNFNQGWLFGEAWCQLKYHLEVDPCAIYGIKDTCRNDADKFFYYLVIGGVMVAALTLLFCIVGCAVHCCRCNNRPATAPAADERSPLQPEPLPRTNYWATYDLYHYRYR